MIYEAPPMKLKAKDKGSRIKFKKICSKTKGKRSIVIKKATIIDVEEILDLINGFAASNLMLSRGPQYLYENIRDFVIAVDKCVPVRVDENDKNLHLIVGCCSLHMLWEDIAEIRSLAIHPDYQHLGLGRKMIYHIKSEAIQLRIKRLFTFTLTDEFFKTLGFKLQKRDELPPKVWGECSRCPKYFKCDEVGMVLEL